MPCNIYSVTPTSKKELNCDINSEIINAGAAIIDTPRFALLQRVTPNATKTIPKTHNSSDDALTLFIGTLALKNTKMCNYKYYNTQIHKSKSTYFKMKYVDLYKKNIFLIYIYAFIK